MWLESIPNISEGKSSALVNSIAVAFTQEPSDLLLDIHLDPSHNRGVITAAISPETLVNACCNLVEQSCNVIDLRQHRGEHPRIGALDVLPFVPMEGLSHSDSIELIHLVAQEIAVRYSLPVFICGDPRSKNNKLQLTKLRKGGTASLEKRISNGELKPDYGPSQLHATAGATAISVRKYLIAFNVALKSTNINVARIIATKIRESSGGLRAVQAIPISLHHRGIVQVSMNLTNFKMTSIFSAFNAVRNLAVSLGVEIDHSEIVGLIPAAASFNNMFEKLMLEKKPRILEDRIEAARYAVITNETAPN